MRWLAGFLVVAAAAGALVLYAGWYDISATDQHLRPTYWLLDTAMKRSIRWRAAKIDVPDLDDPKQIALGAPLYRGHCEQCHGGPGVAPAPFALGMTPAPAALVHTARAWPPAEIFWVVKEGIKMTGMPAWKYRMSDDEIWALVAFLRAMARMTPQQYRGLPAPRPAPHDRPLEGEPDADRGRRALEQYACVTCHAIPGVVGANAPVGPPLAGVGARTMLGGVLPNSPENMARWLRAPQRYAPLTAMPDLGVTERDARDIAAYLATLR
jgi:mono/diheme cytochrome c family protein